MALLQGQGGISTRRGLNGQQQGIGGMNPNLALLLMGSGKMQIHRNLDGSIQMPGQQQAPQTMAAWRMQAPSSPTPAQPTAQPQGDSSGGFDKFFNDPNNAPKQTQSKFGEGGFQSAGANPSFVPAAQQQAQAGQWDSIINKARAEVASPAYQQRQQDRSVAPFMQGAMAPQQQFSSPGTAIPQRTPEPAWGPIAQPSQQMSDWVSTMRGRVDSPQFDAQTWLAQVLGIPRSTQPNLSGTPTPQSKPFYFGKTVFAPPQ